MTARDELIRWLMENAASDTADAEELVEALESVPPAVLAQLAIDTGALKRVEVAADDYDLFDWEDPPATTDRLPSDTRLYRIVEEGA